MVQVVERVPVLFARRLERVLDDQPARDVIRSVAAGVRDTGPHDDHERRRVVGDHAADGSVEEEPAPGLNPVNRIIGFSFQVRQSAFNQRGRSVERITRRVRVDSAENRVENQVCCTWRSLKLVQTSPNAKKSAHVPEKLRSLGVVVSLTSRSPKPVDGSYSAMRPLMPCWMKSTWSGRGRRDGTATCVHVFDSASRHVTC